MRIQDLGATTFIVIADYQVLTDRDTAEAVGANVHEVILDYLAAGLDPENGRTFFFSHSHIPELNQLLLPFMYLVTTAELDRNPTVKEEIKAAGLRQVNALMYTYPMHQAADILLLQGQRRARGPGPASAPGAHPQDRPPLQRPVRPRGARLPRARRPPQRPAHGAGHRRPEDEQEPRTTPSCSR